MFKFKIKFSFDKCLTFNNNYDYSKNFVKLIYHYGVFDYCCFVWCNSNSVIVVILVTGHCGRNDIKITTKCDNYNTVKLFEQFRTIENEVILKIIFKIEYGL